MALVAGVLLAGSLSTKTIIETQVSNGVWFVFLSPVAFFIYLVASIAETNRAPFDLPEAESELVAGYMTEYSGFRWAVYFLAEYANMIVVSGIAVTIFFGGWQRPFGNTALFNFLDFAPAAGLGLVGLYCFWRIPKLKEKPHRLTMPLFGLLLLGLAALLALPLAVPVVGGVNIKTLLHGAFWFLAKVTVYLYAFMWIRFTFPRYRFDQLMKLGWHFLIPLSLVNLFAVATALLLSKPAELGGAGYALGPAMLAATAVTMLAGGWLAWLSEQRELRDRATTAAPAGD
jgi:NADH-quinone oxidoreductase subunit H